MKDVRHKKLKPSFSIHSLLKQLLASFWCGATQRHLHCKTKVFMALTLACSGSPGSAAVGSPAVGSPAVGSPAVGSPAVGSPAVGWIESDNLANGDLKGHKSSSSLLTITQDRNFQIHESFESPWYESFMKMNMSGIIK